MSSAMTPMTVIEDSDKNGGGISDVIIDQYNRLADMLYQYRYLCEDSRQNIDILGSLHGIASHAIIEMRKGATEKKQMAEWESLLAGTTEMIYLLGRLDERRANTQEIVKKLSKE